MDLVWTIVMFLLGLGLLVKGSDWLVDAAARIAKQFGISNFMIGLTIVSLGTSLPELATEITASFFGNSDIIMGDIIGSNIANLALVLGLAGLFVPIALKRSIYNRDGAVMLFAVILFYIFSFDGTINAFEGGIFLFLFLAYLNYFITTKKSYKKFFHFQAYLSEYADMEKKEKFDTVPEIAHDFKDAFRIHVIQKALSLRRGVSGLLKRSIESIQRNWNKARKKKAAIIFFAKQVAMLLLGGASIFVGANLVVTNALQLPLPPLATGLVFIAIGTSLPELMVTISSLRKGLPQIMIGNLIGSNIANILWVGGIAAIISPIAVDISIINLDFIFLILITWLFLVFLRNDKKITRIESMTLLLLYIAFIATAFGLRLGI